MFFGIIQQHHSEFKSGVYYAEYPDLQNLPVGKKFRYRDGNRYADVQDIIPNLSHQAEIKTIESTFEMPWIPEQYVLLDDGLYRIISVDKRDELQQVAIITRSFKKRYTVMLRKVSNATREQL